MTQAASEETVDNEVQANDRDDRDDRAESMKAEELLALRQEQQDGKGANADANAEDDEDIVTIGDSPTPEEQDESRAPEWVRELRKSNREKDRKLREQEAEIARLRGAGQQPAAIVVGEKPTLEGCNFDAGKFEADLEAWHARKRAADEQEAQKAAAQQKVQQEWSAKLASYVEGKKTLRVKDYDDVEAAVTGALNVVQQGVILNGAENPNLVVYALGKSPQKLKELAAITDPVKFAFAVAKLETQVKVSPKKTAPPPERKVQSSVAGAAAVDNQLEKLREEASKSGDWSKVHAYKRQRRGSE